MAVGNPCGAESRDSCITCLREGAHVACAELGLSITSGGAVKVNAPPHPEHSRGMCWAVMELGLRNTAAWLLLLLGPAV